MSQKSQLMQVYQKLYGHYGAQQWWPADTPEEIIIGAVLTQNTAWSNVEKAIANLRQAESLSLSAISQMPHDQLAQLIRPSGYFNVKSKRLQALCRWVEDQQGHQALSLWSTNRLREALLQVHGVGPETADDIILYAFERPVFVVDAYTRRLFFRLGIFAEQDYETLRALFESNLQSNAKLFSEYHALIVIHAKEVCRKKPLCDACVLSRDCSYISEC